MATTLLANKKISIIGRGTAGSFSLNHFSRYTNYEIECYYDSNIKEQSVGEGSAVVIPETLYETLQFNYVDLQSINGTIKTGISYQNWGVKDYFHSFEPPYVSIHFNALKLQEYLQYKNKKRVKFIDSNVNIEDIDSDYIIDCSGTPNIDDTFNKAEYIPVNSVVLHQIPVKQQVLNYTLCIARPYGWVFGIPLTDKISFGYLFNKDINRKEEVVDDLTSLVKELGYGIIYKDTFKNIDFNNYYRKNNFNENIFYNGNASFFLEPMEATSISSIDTVNRKIYDIINGNTTDIFENAWYQEWFKQIQEVITLHYFAGSKYKTKFWEYAKDLATECMKNFEVKAEIIRMYKKNEIFTDSYGTWGSYNFKQNIEGLGIRKQLLML